MLIAHANFDLLNHLGYTAMQKTQGYTCMLEHKLTWFQFKYDFAFQVYAVSILIGAGGSQMMITCLCLVADLIANNLDSSAFVYGCMSLVDKFSNGLVIMLIQHCTPATSDKARHRSQEVYSKVMSQHPNVSVGRFLQTCHCWFVCCCHCSGPYSHRHTYASHCWL